MEIFQKAMETMSPADDEMWWGTLGTVRPFPNFNSERDAREVQVALEKKDMNTLVRVLTNRTNAQRQLVAQAYRSLAGKELSAMLKKCLTGGLQDLLLGLMMTPSQFDAHRLRQAMEGLGTDEETLLEVLCTRSREQLKEIIVVYNQEFGRYLENDLISETSKDFTKLLLAILTKEQENLPGVIDYELIDRDVKTLAEAVNGKKVDSAPWIKVLTTRDADHLDRVLLRLESVKGETVDKMIHNHFSGDLRLGLRTLVHSIQNTPLYLAHRLHNSIKKGAAVRGILVSRSEEDLLSVRVEYRRLAQVSLYSALQKEFKGDLQQAYLALCQAEDV
ncbi:annexin A2 [Scleropages formosus]|uniref:Annexin n=1 Tax=Scleropages formosus TaxID=113540 RepID=A0A8C9S556_SCLFO|nr:annexin A2-like [Scleropages formosus]